MNNNKKKIQNKKIPLMSREEQHFCNKHIII